MRQRFGVCIGVALTLVVTLMPSPAGAQGASSKAATGRVQPAAAAKTWTAPKTPWGDPDLQGTFTSDDYIGVGLQRNPQFGDRLYLTEQEIAQRETQIANQSKADLVDTVGPNARATTGPPGHWGERAKR